MLEILCIFTTRRCYFFDQSWWVAQ